MSDVTTIRRDRVDTAVNHLWRASDLFQTETSKQMTEVEWECVVRRLIECIKTGKPTFGW